jgi:hypothetical protein
VEIRQEVPLARVSLQSQFNNPKRASISVASNGFVVSMQKVTEYGEEWAIAATVEDITKIISDYFAA